MKESLGASEKADSIVLDLHTVLYIYSASSVTQQVAGEHVTHMLFYSDSVWTSLSVTVNGCNLSYVTFQGNIEIGSDKTGGCLVQV